MHRTHGVVKTALGVPCIFVGVPSAASTRQPASYTLLVATYRISSESVAGCFSAPSCISSHECQSKYDMSSRKAALVQPSAVRYAPRHCCRVLSNTLVVRLRKKVA